VAAVKCWEAGDPKPVDKLRTGERVMYLRVLDPLHTGHGLYTFLHLRGYVLNHVCVNAYERWPTCRQTCARHSSGKQRLPEPAQLPGLA
jgi:hypothetical protein